MFFGFYNMIHLVGSRSIYDGRIWFNMYGYHSRQR